MPGKENTRNKIVEAAKKRFSHFGYGKTTMAEVATDCAMSPGNLYRFFPGKLDIAIAIAQEENDRHIEAMRKLAVTPGKDLRQRLHDIMFKELQRTYHKLEEDPRAYEMVSVIRHERPEFTRAIYAKEKATLVSLLEESERRGEARWKDKGHVAEVIQSATVKFRYPQFWSQQSLPELERELKGVLELLLNGVWPKEAVPAQDHAAA